MKPISVDGVLPPKTTSNSFEWPGNGKAATVALPFELLLLFGAGMLATVLHQSFRLPLHMPGYHGMEWLAILMLVLRAYERGDPDMAVEPVEAWIAPYRVVRL